MSRRGLSALMEYWIEGQDLVEQLNVQLQVHFYEFSGSLFQGSVNSPCIIIEATTCIHQLQ